MIRDLSASYANLIYRVCLIYVIFNRYNALISSLVTKGAEVKFLH